MRRRTRARELALKYLYCLEGTKEHPKPEADAFLDDHTSDDEVRRFALELVRGCIEHAPAIDEMIKGVAKRWDISRMAATDRCVIKIGVFELLFRDDIPPQVTLNEAIDLAKRYGAEKSGPFVNGMLDAVRDKLGREPFDSSTRGQGRIPDPEGETTEEPDEGGEFPTPLATNT